MGAADVVPFIPIEGLRLSKNCAAMPGTWVNRFWKRYQIPVYLYEAAGDFRRAAESGEHPARPV